MSSQEEFDLYEKLSQEKNSQTLEYTILSLSNALENNQASPRSSQPSPRSSQPIRFHHTPDDSPAFDYSGDNNNNLSQSSFNGSPNVEFSQTSTTNLSQETRSQISELIGGTIYTNNIQEQIERANGINENFSDRNVKERERAKQSAIRRTSSLMDLSLRNQLNEKEMENGTDELGIVSVNTIDSFHQTLNAFTQKSIEVNGQVLSQTLYNQMWEAGFYEVEVLNELLEYSHPTEFQKNDYDDDNNNNNNNDVDNNNNINNLDTIGDEGVVAIEAIQMAPMIDNNLSWEEKTALQMNHIQSVYQTNAGGIPTSEDNSFAQSFQIGPGSLWAKQLYRSNMNRYYDQFGYSRLQRSRKMLTETRGPPNRRGTRVRVRRLIIDADGTGYIPQSFSNTEEERYPLPFVNKYSFLVDSQVDAERKPPYLVNLFNSVQGQCNCQDYIVRGLMFAEITNCKHMFCARKKLNNTERAELYAMTEANYIPSSITLETEINPQTKQVWVESIQKPQRQNIHLSDDVFSVQKFNKKAWNDKKYTVIPANSSILDRVQYNTSYFDFLRQQYYEYHFVEGDQQVFSRQVRRNLSEDEKIILRLATLLLTPVASRRKSHFMSPLFFMCIMIIENEVGNVVRNMDNHQISILQAKFQYAQRLRISRAIIDWNNTVNTELFNDSVARLVALEPGTPGLTQYQAEKILADFITEYLQQVSNERLNQFDTLAQRYPINKVKEIREKEVLRRLNTMPTLIMINTRNDNQPLMMENEQGIVSIVPSVNEKEVMNTIEPLIQPPIASSLPPSVVLNQNHGGNLFQQMVQSNSNNSNRNNNNNNNNSSSISAQESRERMMMINQRNVDTFQANQSFNELQRVEQQITGGGGALVKRMNTEGMKNVNAVFNTITGQVNSIGTNRREYVPNVQYQKPITEFMHGHNTTYQKPYSIAELNAYQPYQLNNIASVNDDQYSSDEESLVYWNDDYEEEQQEPASSYFKNIPLPPVNKEPPIVTSTQGTQELENSEESGKVAKRKRDDYENEQDEYDDEHRQNEKRLKRAVTVRKMGRNYIYEYNDNNNNNNNNSSTRLERKGRVADITIMQMEEYKRRKEMESLMKLSSDDNVETYLNRKQFQQRKEQDLDTVKTPRLDLSRLNPVIFFANYNNNNSSSSSSGGGDSTINQQSQSSVETFSDHSFYDFDQSNEVAYYEKYGIDERNFSLRFDSRGNNNNNDDVLSWEDESYGTDVYFNSPITNSQINMNDIDILNRREYKDPVDRYAKDKRGFHRELRSDYESYFLLAEKASKRFKANLSLPFIANSMKQLQKLAFPFGLDQNDFYQEMAKIFFEWVKTIDPLHTINRVGIQFFRILRDHLTNYSESDQFIKWIPLILDPNFFNVEIVYRKESKKLVDENGSLSNSNAANSNKQSNANSNAQKKKSTMNANSKQKKSSSLNAKKTTKKKTDQSSLSYEFMVHKEKENENLMVLSIVDRSFSFRKEHDSLSTGLHSLYNSINFSSNKFSNVIPLKFSKDTFEKYTAKIIKIVRDEIDYVQQIRGVLRRNGADQRGSILLNIIEKEYEQLINEALRPIQMYLMNINELPKKEKRLETYKELQKRFMKLYRMITTSPIPGLNELFKTPGMQLNNPMKDDFSLASFHLRQNFIDIYHLIGQLLQAFGVYQSIEENIKVSDERFLFK